MVVIQRHARSRHYLEWDRHLGRPAAIVIAPVVEGAVDVCRDAQAPLAPGREGRRLPPHMSAKRTRVPAGTG